MNKNLDNRIGTAGKKLSLNKETLKQLDSKDLARIAGGQVNRPPTDDRCYTGAC